MGLLAFVTRSDQELLVDSNGLTVPPGCSNQRLQVAFDGRPVLAADHFLRGRRLPWPAGLRPVLERLGPTQVSLINDSGRVVVGADHNFGGPEPSDEVFLDSHGRWQTVNKWGWLDVRLAQFSEQELDLLLDATVLLQRHVESLGYPVWAVGGTLLGAVRAGRVIPHDDDADLAYLSRHSLPSEVARESFALERALAERGWGTRRFSGAHLQLTPAGEADSSVHVDLFSAFFHDGEIHQPFHIRGPFTKAQLLPLSIVTLHGRELPAPADVPGWLELNYGPDWETPNPGHRFGTPRATRERYFDWFGRYRMHHEYWSADRRLPTNGSSGDEPAPSATAHWLANELPAGTVVVELGAGDGSDARYFAGQGRAVLASDFITGDPAAPTSLPESGLALAEVNLAEWRDLLTLAIACRRDGRPVHVYARRVLDGVPDSTRAATFEFLTLLPRGSTATICVADAPGDPIEVADPTSWHIDREMLERECAPHGIVVELLPHVEPSHDGRPVKNYRLHQRRDGSDEED